MSNFGPRNPGLDFPDELTSSELLFIQGIASLDYSDGDILIYDNGQFVNTQIGTGLYVPYTGAASTVDLGSENITSLGIGTFGSVFVDDEAYGPGWSLNLSIPTKNAIYDALQSISGAVSSVNGSTGVVVLDSDDISEGSTNLYYTTERAQDDIGAMINSTLVYTDATPVLGRAAITGDITIAAGSNTSAIGSGVIVNADINASAAIDASKIADGTVSSTEFQYLDGVTSAIQTQITARVSLTGNETIAGVKTFSSIPELPASDPTTANQAVRKSYVDVIGQMVDPSLYKNACTCATTANITLSGEQTIDGFTTSATRVLVWNQTTTSQNGIYISDSGAWTRASDYNTAAEVLQGTSTFITDGTVNKNRLFVMNAASVTTLGTDPVTFTPLSGLNEYVAGNGITISTNTISTDNTYLNANLTFVKKSGTVATNSIAIFANTSGDVKDSGLKITGTTAITLANDGGSLLLRGKNSNSGVAGTVNINGGNGTGSTVDGANVSIYGGDFTSFPGIGRTAGSVVIAGGNGDPNFTGAQADGGNVIISGGDNPLGGGSTAFIGIYGCTYAGASGYMEIQGSPINITSNNSIRLYNSSTDTGYYYYLDFSPAITADTTLTLPETSGTLSLSTDVQIFTSSGTWTKPAGAKSVSIQLIGGGGGGGSGRKGAAGTVRAGGAGGGAGGWSTSTFPVSILGSTVTVTVGTGGAGGASRTANDSSGLPGTSGNPTTFGGWLRAGGGSGGSGGATGAASGGFSGQLFPPSSSSSQNGGQSSATGTGGTSSGNNQYAPGAGGGAGGITTANVASSGGNGGGVGSSGVSTGSGYGTSISGGPAGTSGGAGSNGNVSPTNSGIGGSGGGGGASSTTTNGGNGGNGATYGGGGGGGGAATNSVGNSGAGGSGAKGIAIITTYF